MAELIYSLCAAASLACTWLLFSAYRRNKFRLLFWSGVCFTGFTVNNIVLIIDKLVFLDVDLLSVRLVIALLSLVFLLFGLIYSKE